MKKTILAAMAAALLLGAGCSKNTGETTVPSGDAVLKVTLKGETGTRSTAALADEAAIKNFTVLVYNYTSGVLEKFKSVTDGSTSTTLVGLNSAGAKRVVVIANGDGLMPSFVEGSSNYSALANTANSFSLESQKTDKTFLDGAGLIMTGEATGAITLSPSDPNTVSVTVKRLVAKVVLGSITVDATAAAALPNFTLKSVSIQQANSLCTFSTGAPVTGGDQWGGIVGTTSAAAKSYLLDNNLSFPGGYTAGTPASFGNFFYIFPNGSVNPAILTIGGEYSYDGTNPLPTYFPVIINNRLATGIDGDNTDGTYVQRNYVYTLNITLKNLTAGSNDPDILPTSVSLEVDVDVANWEGPIVQNETW